MAQIPPRSAVVDVATGNVTPEWLSWLQSIADVSQVAGGTAPGGGPTTPTRPGVGSGDGVSIVNNYGEGTPGKITKWLATQTLGDSIMSEAGGTVTVNGSLKATVSLAAPILQGSLDVKYLGGGVPNAFLLTTMAGTPFFSPDVPFHLLPTSNEAYDIGRFDRLWRNGWISKINAVVFALTTQTLFGGYSTIAKNAGTFKVGVASFETNVDFGTTMTPGEWVLVRAHSATGVITPEYMLVGSLVGGTRYNVTRDLNNVSSPDPTWVAGTPWMLLGTTGDGRIDMFAYDGKPKILFNVQGATFNAFSSRAAIGNLNGYFGYVTDVFGACFGNPAASWVKIDDTNGVRLGNNTTTTVRINTTGASSFESGISVGTTGVLFGGVATDLDHGDGFWLAGGPVVTFRVGKPDGANQNYLRWHTNDGVGSTGTLTVKSASVIINPLGIRVGPLSTVLDTLYAYDFISNMTGQVGMFAFETTPSRRILELFNKTTASPEEAHVYLQAASASYVAAVNCIAYPVGSPTGLTSQITFTANAYSFSALGGGVNGTAQFDGPMGVKGPITINGGPQIANDITGSLSLTPDSSCTYYFRGTSGGITALLPFPTLTVFCGHPSFQWLTMYCQSVVQSSDARVKRDFAPADLGLAFLDRLPVHAFRYRTDAADAPRRMGFTTQDVEAALEPGQFFAALHKHADGDGLDYAAFVPVLTKAVQELAAQVRALEARVG
jgi:hypothetical protein